MTEEAGKDKAGVTADAKGDQDQDQKTDQMIPRSRLNQEIDKRRNAEKELNEVADELIQDVPENLRDMIPNLPASEKIRWLRAEQRKGLFDPKKVESIDSKRPSDKQPQDFSNLSPQQMMSRGHKT